MADNREDEVFDADDGAEFAHEAKKQIIGSNAVEDHSDELDGEEGSSRPKKKIMDFLFSACFNTEVVVKRKDYQMAIKNLRYLLDKVVIAEGKVHPPAPHEKEFRILLETNTHVVSLMFRFGLCDQRDLQLIGYQMGKSAEWLEFRSSDTSFMNDNLIVGSSLLDFKADIDSLERVSGVSRKTNVLCPEELICAINCLAISTEAHERAQSLIVVTKMIIEPIKLDSKFKEVADNYPASDVVLPNCDDLIETIPGVDFRRDLMEVFAVYIQDYLEQKPGYVHGEIMMVEHGGNCIYSRSRKKPELIKQHETVLLSGDECIVAVDFPPVTHVFLQRTGTGLVNGWFGRDIRPENDIPLDGILSYAHIRGIDSSVRVIYAVFPYAVQAKVEVMVTHLDQPAEVYGQITARNSNFSNFESLLFRIQKDSREQFVKLSHEMLIPLSRSVVAVPFDAFLEVRVDLCDVNTIPSVDKIAKAKFVPKFSGTVQKEISFQYGLIEVKVTWEDIV